MKAFYKLMLNASLLGGLAFLTAAAGCSDSNKTDNNDSAAGDSGNKAGSSAAAGKSAAEAGSSSNGAAGDNTVSGGAGGAASVGGASQGGAGQGGAGQGGVGEGGDAPITNSGGGPDVVFAQGGQAAGGAGTGPSVAKFCNTLSFGNSQVTMVLEVGTGADKVTFTAVTGTCAPADGEACTPIPQGADVPIVMFDHDDPSTILDSGSGEILPGQDWVLYTDLDTSGADPQPIFQGGPLQSATCESVNYSDIAQ